MPNSSIMKENTDRKPASDMGDQDNTRIGMLRQPETPYERRQLSKHDVGWRRILRNFTPSYVLVPSLFQDQCFVWNSLWMLTSMLDGFP